MSRSLLIALLLASAVGAEAQTSDKLALLIPNLFGPDGLKVDSSAVLPDGSTHSAHFNNAFQSEFGQFNVALGSQLGSVPLPSPASGYTYEFDSTLGVFKRSTQSFGPTLAERAETIGRGKFTFGFGYQGFTYDSIEGVDLGNLPAVFSHDDAQLGGGRSDIVTTANSIQTSVNRFVSFLSYGLTDRIDVSLAIPVVSVKMDLTSLATIQRIGTTNPAVHFFKDANGGFGDQKTFAKSGTANGLGDLILRIKGAAPRMGSTAIGLAVDVRFPTGDEQDFLGSGAWGIKPALVASWTLGRVSPHVDLAYQWNGKSLLGGDVAKGVKGDLPDQFLYTAGIDVGVTKSVTLGVDVIGQRMIDSPRLVSQTFTAANGQTFGNITFTNGSFYMTNLAAGGKFNVAGKLLIDATVLVKLDNAGLRDKLTPLVGFEYSF
jgi:hypothetical protein